jgi:hypothetical protein
MVKGSCARANTTRGHHTPSFEVRAETIAQLDAAERKELNSGVMTADLPGESLADGRLYYDRVLNETFIKPGATGLDYFRGFIPPWAERRTAVASLRPS